jgi:hypothetical protein
MLGEIVQEYDKRFKDFLSQIPYMIDDKLLVQWYALGLLQKIHGPLRIHEIQLCEEVINKDQHIETDE